MSTIHAIRKSLQLAAIGFAIPAIVIGLFACYHFTFREIHPLDRERDLARLPFVMLSPSFGLSFIFGLSALASSFSRNSLSFLRCLILIAGATVAARLATQARMQGRADEVIIWWDVVTPVAVALVVSMAIVIFGRRSATQKRSLV